MPDPILLTAWLTFLVIALAARQIGDLLARVHLPLITGFLVAGIVVGPYLLGILGPHELEHLRFLEELSLGFIGFSAGAELHLREFRSRFPTIRWVTLGQLLSTFLLSTLSLFLLAGVVPFMRAMPWEGRLGVALLGAAILVARSPSSAIAIINELRARGPFTRLALGVTVTMDVVVILLFSINSSIADLLFTQTGFRVTVALLVLVEIGLALALGGVLGKVLGLAGRGAAGGWLRATLLLLCTSSAFFLSSALRHWSHQVLGLEIFLEPLLVCMVAGFVVTNYTPAHSDFQRTSDQVGPPLYLIFFTLTGASLDFASLSGTWKVALLLVLVRAVAIFAGSLLGGMAAGDPWRLNRISWMAFITQAGIGLGLAREVAAEFEPWGTAFATMMIAVIIMNQLLGPPLFKWALHLAGESRLKAGRRDLAGTPRAFIFGLEGQSLALARQLSAHGWAVKVITRQRERAGEGREAEVELLAVPDLGGESLAAAGAGEANAFVCLMRDNENLEVCRAAYERFGTSTVVVRSEDRFYWERYRALGARIVDPGVAMVSLLDHFVRSPSAASLLLGMERDQDVVELVVSNPQMAGLALRDLKLPLDTLVLSVAREGASLISHGYTRLRLGDRVTLVGSQKSLEEVELKLL